MRKRALPVCLAQNPRHEHPDDVLLFRIGQGSARRDAVPFGQASPATAGRGMLGDEDRMAPHGSLPAVVGRCGRCKTGAYEILGMAPDRCKALLYEVRTLGIAQAEAAAKRRAGQASEQRLQILRGIRSCCGRSRFCGVRHGADRTDRREKFRIRTDCPAMRTIRIAPAMHQSTKRALDSSRGRASGASSG